MATGASIDYGRAMGVKANMQSCPRFRRTSRRARFSDDRRHGGGHGGGQRLLFLSFRRRCPAVGQSPDGVIGVRYDCLQDFGDGSGECADAVPVHCRNSDHRSHRQEPVGAQNRRDGRGAGSRGFPDDRRYGLDGGPHVDRQHQDGRRQTGSQGSDRHADAGWLLPAVSRRASPWCRSRNTSTSARPTTRP